MYLEELGRERDETIEKLKRATRYDSTQELIEKYGASSKGNTPKTMMDGEKGAKKRQSTGAQAHQGQGQQRVFIQPPPTANIPRGPPQPQPQQQPQTASRPTSPPLPPPPPPSQPKNSPQTPSPPLLHPVLNKHSPPHPPTAPQPGTTASSMPYSAKTKQALRTGSRLFASTVNWLMGRRRPGHGRWRMWGGGGVLVVGG